MENFNSFFRPLRLADRSTIVGTFLILIMAVTAIFYGGWDFLSSIRVETLSGEYFYTYNPYPSYWFFLPFAILPPKMGYLLWNLANAFCLIFALRYWKGNFSAFAITIGCFWMFYGGEYDGFLAGALVLALTANPWLAGFGLFVLTIKPQVGLIPILYILLQRRNWRMLAFPAALYLLSFAVHGWWIPEWLAHIRTGYNTHLLTPTNISMYPAGMLALFLIFRYWKSLKIWILAGSLAMPYFPVYSLVTLFTMEPPAWQISAAMWLFYIVPTLIPSLAWILSMGFIIPLFLLALEIWKIEKSKTRPRHELKMEN